MDLIKKLEKFSENSKKLKDEDPAEFEKERDALFIETQEAIREIKKATTNLIDCFRSQIFGITSILPYDPITFLPSSSDETVEQQLFKLFQSDKFVNYNVLIQSTQESRIALKRLYEGLKILSFDIIAE
jgi:hypothetical protein